VQYFYFDHNATTPVAPEVSSAYIAALAEVYGNASSIHHFGQAAKQRLEMSRRQVAAGIGAKAKEIVFVSGGTEADNLAIRGMVRAGQHVVTTAIEHPAVLNACVGIDATVVPVGGDGVVDPSDIQAAIRPNTVLVSVIHANNEIGTIQPIAEISRIARAAGAYLHADGVQAAGKIPVNVDELGVDLYSISGHKIGAPKGIGALYVDGECSGRRGARRSDGPGRMCWPGGFAGQLGARDSFARERSIGEWRGRGACSEHDQHTVRRN
jgi:cysteine desulfurase